MHTQKLSISLSAQQYDFLETYKAEHQFKSRSDVIKKALALLQQLELEACYREANDEIDDSLDVTISDGIDNDETW